MKLRLRRRRFGQLIIVSTIAAAIANFVRRITMAQAPIKAPNLTPQTSDTIKVTLQVNGTAHTLQIEPRVTLLDALREYIGLTGSSTLR